MTVVSDGSVHGPIHQLGPEWVPGADGVRFRRAARVILLDADDRVLLLHGSDVDARGDRIAVGHRAATDGPGVPP